VGVTAGTAAGSIRKHPISCAIYIIGNEGKSRLCRKAGRATVNEGERLPLAIRTSSCTLAPLSAKTVCWRLWKRSAGVSEKAKRKVGDPRWPLIDQAVVGNRNVAGPGSRATPTPKRPLQAGTLVICKCLRQPEGGNNGRTRVAGGVTGWASAHTVSRRLLGNTLTKQKLGLILAPRPKEDGAGPGVYRHRRAGPSPNENLQSTMCFGSPALWASRSPPVPRSKTAAGRTRLSKTETPARA